MMKKSVKTKAWLAALATVVFALSCRTPEIDRFDPVAEKVMTPGLERPVKVVRDANGIVHIEGETEADLFYAAGYAMAQDRFTQMDYFRRAGAGKLSAMMGSPAKIMGIGLPNIDRALRVFRFEDTAKQAVANLDPESRALLAAFTAGVNQYLNDGGDSIGVYVGWNIKPEPWTMEDCFISAELMGLTMTLSSFAEEYYLERVRREQGDELRDLFVPQYSDDDAIITRDALLTASAAPDLFRNAAGLGSNNWALAGGRTVSGKPLLANDPHVPISIAPTFWWHCHLKGAGYDVMGLMFPGFPCFGAATNGKVAWALTNVMADYIDLWREQVNPDNPGQYRLPDGSWANFEVIEGEVEVRGKKAEPYAMRLSRHGVVLEKELLGWEIANEPNEVLVLKYVDMDLARFFRGYQAMARAGNFDEWKAGARDESWGPFAWNHMYADNEGNIAYWASGRFPIRLDNQGYIARRGWEAGQDWQGYVDFEDNPHLVNPQKNYLVSANNRVQTPDYPHYITVDYSGPSRASRISELIEQTEKHDVDDMQRIQYDVAVWEARRLVPIILADLADAKEKPLLDAAALLADWGRGGYISDIDSAGTCVFEVFMANFPGAVFGDELGAKTSRGAGQAGLMGAGLSKIIGDPDNKWFDDVKTRPREDRRAIVRRTMKDAMKSLTKSMGRDSSQWKWGEISTLTMSPSFVAIPGWTAKYSLGPYPLPGTRQTVRAGDQLYLGSSFMGFIGPSTHFIVDFRDPRRAYFNCSAGMAEFPLGERYGNLTPAWLDARYLVMSMEPDEYRKDMMGEMTLTPKP